MRCSIRPVKGAASAQGAASRRNQFNRNVRESAVRGARAQRSAAVVKLVVATVATAGPVNVST